MVELLLSIGTLATIGGLLLFGLSGARQTARLNTCRADMATHMRMLFMYANDFRESWPAGLAPGPRGEWTAWWHRDRRVVNFEAIGGLWHMPMLEAYGNKPFAEVLVCPVERNIVAAERDAAAATLGVAASVVGGTLTRRLSMSLYLVPEALDPDNPRWGADFWRIGRIGDVAFASQKAALIEALPLHEPKGDDSRVIHQPPWMFVVGNADGAVVYRSTAEAVPGILVRGPRVAQTRQAEIEAAKLDYTPWGSRGRDW